MKSVHKEIKIDIIEGSNKLVTSSCRSWGRVSVLLHIPVRRRVHDEIMGRLKDRLICEIWDEIKL